MTEKDAVAAEKWEAVEAQRMRRLALLQLTDHGHSWSFRDRDDRQLTRENCAACVLNGYGDRDEPGDRAPNYAGWARVYVQAGNVIPKKYRAAFDAELASDNAAYAAALARDIATFGVHYA